MGPVIAWLFLSLVVSLASLWIGRTWSERASARLEVVDFKAVSGCTRWDVDRLRRLPGPVGEFVRQWQAETAEALRLDLLCERLSDVDVDTRQIATRLGRLGRLQVAVGMLLGIVLVLQSLRDSTPSVAFLGVAPPAAGLLSAFLLNWMGRAAGQAAESRRREWDALSRWLMRPHMIRSCEVVGDPLRGHRGGHRTEARCGESEDLRWNLEGNGDVMVSLR